jgi:uncharacterized protein (DUF2235 family)
MKKLAVYLDGTFNTLNNNTNVWRLRSLTSQTPDQCVYYSQGVGTKRGEVARGGVAGYGVDDEIIDAYTWLIENFDDGDDFHLRLQPRRLYGQEPLGPDQQVRDPEARRTAFH